MSGLAREDDAGIGDDGPFGPSEGERADLRVSEHFIPIDPHVGSSDLSMNAYDRSARVIVGRKGSGKTLYLRRLHAGALQDDALYVDDYRSTSPSTHEIIKVSDWYGGRITSEKWEGIWRTAILRSLVSHVLCAPPLKESLDPRVEADLRRAVADLYCDFGTPRSIYGQLSEVIGLFTHGRQLDQHVASPRWEEVEHLLTLILRESPPVFFYLDAVDDRFELAPSHWLLCQLGLFFAIWNLLRHPPFGGRLHIVICIRDHVYSATQKSEHRTKFMDSPYIRLLTWNRDAIRYLLREKLEGLPPEFLSDDESRTTSGWLGLSVINNDKRGVHEDVERYLIRHTRLLPRDVVILGNRLSREVALARRTESRGVPEPHLREIVRRAARKFGGEQIDICVNQVSATVMPVLASLQGYDTVYTSEGYAENVGLHAQYRRILVSLLGRAEVDRFGTDVFERLDRELQIAFEDIDVASILWQNGLIGYTDGPILSGPTTFYQAAQEDDLEIPRGRNGYVLHPILIDSVPGLRGVGSPVEPDA